ncbi:MAG: hypothetical protein WD069_15790 [Planctomycetales bacterium]
MSKFEPGDPVVYRKSKFSTHPGPRAKSVAPAPRGETYSYVVDKFWTVVSVTEDDRLLIRTRRGKEHVVNPSDPNLRRARWWERLLYRHRFPEIGSPISEVGSKR